MSHIFNKHKCFTTLPSNTFAPVNTGLCFHKLGSRLENVFVIARDSVDLSTEIPTFVGFSHDKTLSWLGGGCPVKLFGH